MTLALLNICGLDIQLQDQTVFLNCKGGGGEMFVLLRESLVNVCLEALFPQTGMDWVSLLISSYGMNQNCGPSVGSNGTVAQNLVANRTLYYCSISSLVSRLTCPIVRVCDVNLLVISPC